MAKLNTAIEIEFESEAGMPDDALLMALERAVPQIQSAIEDGVPAGVSTGIKKGSVKITVAKPIISE